MRARRCTTHLDDSDMRRRDGKSATLHIGRFLKLKKYDSQRLHPLRPSQPPNSLLFRDRGHQVPCWSVSSAAETLSSSLTRHATRAAASAIFRSAGGQDGASWVFTRQAHVKPSQSSTPLPWRGLPCQSGHQIQSTPGNDDCHGMRSVQFRVQRFRRVKERCNFFDNVRKCHTIDTSLKLKASSI